jgi:hypothetical protein
MIATTWSGASACAVRKTALFVDRLRKLPETSSTRQGLARVYVMA